MSVRRQFHYGLVNLSDGKSKPQPARLKLCAEFLIVQREEYLIPEDDDGYPVDNKLRTVRLRRQPDGSLGISIKGGLDHNLPILVSKVCTNEDDDHVYIGDAILKANHTPLSLVTHDEAINVLRNAGTDVVLTVKHYRSAAPFLLRNVRQFIPEVQNHGLEATDGNRNPAEPAPSVMPPMLDSPSSVASDGSTSNWNGIPGVRRKWVDVVHVPLMMAYITRYIFGTDKIRPGSFEVRGMNGSNTGVIQIHDLAVLSHWIKLISDFINALTSLKGAQMNRRFSASDQVSYMSWVAEGVLNQNQLWQNWKPVFLALRGAHVCIFDKPPMDPSDWPSSSPSTCESVTSYKVYESMFRVIKESENVDERQHCFLIQTAGSESRYFSMETTADLLKLESSWHRSVCSTVSQLGSKTFHVVYKNLPAALTLDWTDGFLLKQFAASGYAFIYSFSQLKNSSDDGNATLRLHFEHPPGAEDLTIQEMICPKLQELLFFMHSFLTAKVASLDPTFMSRGRLA